MRPMAKTTEPPTAKKRGSSARGSPRASNRASVKPPATEALPLRRRTDLPGVWLNQEGAQVDEAGVLLSLRRVKAIEAEHHEAVAESPVPSSPAHFLWLQVLDPLLPLSTRIGCATSAAPYFDRKMPLALEGGDPSRPIKSESSVAIGQLEKLSLTERKSAIALLEKIGLIPKID